MSYIKMAGYALGGFITCSLVGCGDIDTGYAKADPEIKVDAVQQIAKPAGYGTVYAIEFTPKTDPTKTCVTTSRNANLGGVFCFDKK